MILLVSLFCKNKLSQFLSKFDSSCNEILYYHNHMLILGIETSCDETAVALYDTDKGLLAHVLNSQISLHAPYGGVVPEIASRDHLRCLLPLIKKVLSEANVKKPDVIAYTAGPGLEIGRASCRERV